MPRVLIALHPQLLTIALFLFGISCGQAKPQVLQEVGGFDRPVAAVFNQKGDAVFVLNRARGDLGALRGRSFVSKAAVDSAGKVGSPSHKFVTGLTAPSDLDFAPVGYGGLAPVGSLFIVMGTPLIENESGRITKDVSGDFVGIYVIDPGSGEVIKKINLGPDSNLGLDERHTLVSPSAIAFDKTGNLYLADTGIGGHMFKNRARAQPALFRIGTESVTELLEDTAPTDIVVTRISSVPDDICYKEDEDSIFILANHMQGAPKGAVFRIPSEGFSGMASMRTVVRELEALSSIQITPNGRVLLISNGGELMFPRGRKSSRLIRFRPQITFSTPGKVGAHEQADGSLLLAIPEETGDAGVNQGHALSIVLLPAGY